MCTTKKTCFGPRQYVLEANVPRTIAHGLKSSCVVPTFRMNETNEVILLDWSVEDDNTITVTSACNANITATILTSFPSPDSSGCGGCQTGCNTCSSC